MKTRGLGRGLSALIGENLLNNNSGDLNYLPIEKIKPNPNQPRVSFNSEELLELQESIKNNGVLQPILVNSLDDGDSYFIIAGERRWRASKALGLLEIPAIIKNISEKLSFEIALIENIQRSNLTAIEEADGYKKLIDEYNYTQEHIAKIVSKSRSHISNLLRVLTLPKKTKDLLQDGTISLGHAKLLITLEDSSSILDEIVSKKLSVRETESLIKSHKVSSNNVKPSKTYTEDSDIEFIEDSLSEFLGMTIKIKYNGISGNMSISFNNLSQLDLLVKKLSESLN
jgi:ParB family transcriptional regulator, chromosome partitioning protein